MINNNTRSTRVGLLDGGDTVALIIACNDLDMDVIVMHTFVDVDGGVDMHSSSKHPSPFLGCLPPSTPLWLVSSDYMLITRTTQDNNISVDRYTTNIE